MGELTRIRRLTPDDQDALDQFAILRTELRFLGYKSDIWQTALRKKHNKTDDTFWTMVLHKQPKSLLLEFTDANDEPFAYALGAQYVTWSRDKAKQKLHCCEQPGRSDETIEGFRFQQKAGLRMASHIERR